MRISSQSSEDTCAVCVLNWNGLEQTIRCLRSIEQDRLGDVFVLDNGSLAPEWRQLQSVFSDAVVLRSEINLGFAGGMNRLIRLAMDKGYEYLVLLNNDAELFPGALDALVEAMKGNSSFGAISPVILFTGSDRIWYAGALELPGGFVRLLGKGRRYAGKGTGKVSTTVYVAGCCVVFRRQALEQVGLFDEGFFAYFEDFDWSWRARNKGIPVGVLDTPLVWHCKDVNSRVKMSPIQAYLQTRNALLFARKLPLLQRISWFALQTMLLPLSIALRVDWSSGDFKAGHAMLRGWLAGLRGLCGRPRIYS